MKNLLIDRILYILSCNGGETPKDNKPCFNSMRWQPVAEKMYSLSGGYPDSKAFKKVLPNFQLTASDLENLSDKQLIEVFELVMRRAYICM